MRKSLLTATSLSSVAIAYSMLGHAGEARAEDFDWSGFYLGATLGGGFHEGDAKLTPSGSGAYDVYFQSGVPTSISGTNFSSWSSRQDRNQSYISGGVEGGYNWQLGRIVIGLEADGSLLGANHNSAPWSASEPFVIGTSPGTRVSTLSQLGTVDQLFTVRPRIGVTVNKLLLFSTGGLAVGNVTLKTSGSLDEQYADLGKGVHSQWSGSRSEVRPGFVVGGGAEYAFDKHLSIKAEALYFNLGTETASAQGSGSFTFLGVPVAPVTVQPYTVKMLMSGFVFRVGANWRF
jgi:opacity protein-like surface antigen